MQVPSEYIRTEADRLAISQGCYWDEAKANLVLNFGQKYFIPQFTGKKFVPLPWQRDWLRQLYGWRLPGGGSRWRRAFLTCPKKNGKTFLCSLVVLASLYCSSDPSPLVVSASTSRDNATHVYRELVHSIKRAPALDNISQAMSGKKQIKVDSKNGLYQALSADAPTAEGLNCSVVLVDEAAWHRSSALYEALEYSQVAREDGLLLTISTSGPDRTHWFFDHYAKAKRILSGADLDTTTFATVFEVPEGMSPENPEAWVAANPSMGTSFSLDAFRKDMEAAKSNATSWSTFLLRRLNYWTSPADNQWIDLAKWDDCRKEVPEAELKSAAAWIGVDLSQRYDPTSVSITWALPGKRFHVRSSAWVCEAGVKERERQNMPKYQQFAQAGSMAIMKGETLDLQRVKVHILDLCKRYNVKKIIFDPYGAWTLAAELERELGEQRVLRMPQNFKYFSAPTKDFESAVMDRRISHDGSAWLRWCVSCTRLASDAYDNVRPCKQKSSDHIDGIISVLLGYSQAMTASLNPERKSVYQDRGILCI